MKTVTEYPPELVWHLHLCPLCAQPNVGAECQEPDATGEHDCEPHQYCIDYEQVRADSVPVLREE